MTELEIKRRPINDQLSLPGIDSVLQRVLLARGITSSAEMDYGLKNLLAPSGLSHIELAAELLAEAITADAGIVIVGDFDADGATSCALAV
ncbi:MAG: single-stranded-DNA-specific exonuclease RecJ, partial [Gammaproteobacteria bacterium]|nr:single-stranded-DNA-specific exonuclease RecJ [Gammaproteobacteria bacterium]